MHDLVMSLATQLEGTPWGLVARESTWAYPYIQMIHFAGLSIWLGTTFALDLRLLGVGYRRTTPAQVAEDLFVWNWIGFAIVLTGGFILFSGLARTYVENLALQWKLGLFVPLGLVWHIFVQQRAHQWGETHEPPATARFAALAEIFIWLGVVIAAVLIPSY